jgi:hypothetical protein
LKEIKGAVVAITSGVVVVAMYREDRNRNIDIRILVVDMIKGAIKDVTCVTEPF